jgi:hypothetical protein
MLNHKQLSGRDADESVLPALAVIYRNNDFLLKRLRRRTLNIAYQHRICRRVADLNARRSGDSDIPRAALFGVDCRYIRYRNIGRALRDNRDSSISKTLGLSFLSYFSINS